MKKYRCSTVLLYADGIIVRAQYQLTYFSGPFAKLPPTAEPYYFYIATILLFR